MNIVDSHDSLFALSLMFIQVLEDAKVEVLFGRNMDQYNCNILSKNKQLRDCSITYVV